MTPELKKRVDAVLRHFPKGTRWHFSPAYGGVVFVETDGLAPMAKQAAISTGLGLYTFGVSGTWEGDPLDEVLPLGKWMGDDSNKHVAEARARGDEIWFRSLPRRFGEPEHYQICRGTPPPEMPAEVTEEMVEAAHAVVWSHGEILEPVVRAAIQAALKAPPHVCPKPKWTKVDLADKGTWPPGWVRSGAHVDPPESDPRPVAEWYLGGVKTATYLVAGDWWTPLPPGPEEE